MVLKVNKGLGVVVKSALVDVGSLLIDILHGHRATVCSGGIEDGTEVSMGSSSSGIRGRKGRGRGGGGRGDSRRLRRKRMGGGCCGRSRGDGGGIGGDWRSTFW